MTSGRCLVTVVALLDEGLRPINNVVDPGIAGPLEIDEPLPVLVLGTASTAAPAKKP